MLAWVRLSWNSLQLECYNFRQQYQLLNMVGGLVGYINHVRKQPV
jgi:hypothetical protein